MEKSRDKEDNCIYSRWMLLFSLHPSSSPIFFKTTITMSTDLCFLKKFSISWIRSCDPKNTTNQLIPLGSFIKLFNTHHQNIDIYRKLSQFAPIDPLFGIRKWLFFWTARKWFEVLGFRIFFLWLQFQPQKDGERHPWLWMEDFLGDLWLCISL